MGRAEGPSAILSMFYDNIIDVKGDSFMTNKKLYICLINFALFHNKMAKNEL